MSSSSSSSSSRKPSSATRGGTPLTKSFVLLLSTAVVLLLGLAAIGTVTAQGDAPVGPLTTDNAQSACVQFGDCTALPGGATAVTRSQLSPITSPASTPPGMIAPTNSAETEASLSDLASAGGSQVYDGTATGPPVSVDYTSTGPLTGAVRQTSIDFSQSTSTSAQAANAARRMVQRPIGAHTWAPWATGISLATLLGAGVVFLA